MNDKLAVAQAALAHKAAERADGAVGLLARAGTLLAAGNATGAVDIARQAYAVDPWLHGALRLLLSASQRPKHDIIHERAGALIQAGFTATPILVHYLASAAHLGRSDVVARMTRDFLRLDRLHGPDDPDLIPLSAELRHGLRHYAEPETRSIRHGLRRDDLREGADSPLLRRMFERLREVVERYLAELAQAAAADPTHPFLIGLPSRYRLGGWSVVSGADTHHLSHFHPMAWCNGVYYVEVPPIVAETEQRAGWLHVGPPEDTKADFGEWEGRWIQPEAGKIVMMPSYFHHRTMPLGVDQRRVCVAFEVYPEDSPIMEHSEFCEFTQERQHCS